MSTTPRTPNSALPPYRRFWKPAALVAAIAVAGSAGIAFAHGGGMAGWHHGGAMTAEDTAAHVDKFLQHVYVEVDATPAQQAQLDPLLRQAFAEFAPLHTQMHDFHAQLLNALTAETIDRAALETMRQQHIAAADQASKRITQLVGDVADVLTPAQRKALAACRRASRRDAVKPRLATRRATG